MSPVIDRVSRTLGVPPAELVLEPDLPPIRADASLFDEMLANLLENAARYAPGASTRVNVTTCPDGRVRVRVEDAGPGVPPASLPRLFERFYRVPRGNEGARRGLGIGLGVVKGLAEAMDGEVSASASPLGGLAVDVLLRPRPSLRREPGTGQRVTRDGPRGAHILLVEDDATDPVAGRLEPRGARLPGPRGGHGRAALRAWDAQRPDLLVLDLGLPDADGTTVVRRIRRDGTTPILILSARGDEPDKVAALELGADDYVTKPFGLEELRARVTALLRRAAGPAADTAGSITLGPAA